MPGCYRLIVYISLFSGREELLKSREDICSKDLLSFHTQLLTETTSPCLGFSSCGFMVKIMKFTDIAQEGILKMVACVGSLLSGKQSSIP